MNQGQLVQYQTQSFWGTVGRLYNKNGDNSFTIGMSKISSHDFPVEIQEYFDVIYQWGVL